MNIHSIAPLDPAFNDLVVKLAHHYVPCFVIGSDAPSTFKQLKAHLDAGKTLMVASEGSERTIFADPGVNCAFRAWHDWCHWKGDYDFSLYGESATCCMQIDQLYSHVGVNANTLKWAKYLIAEVIGQRQYYEKYREYLTNQRAFVAQYVLDPTKALSRKW